MTVPDDSAALTVVRATRRSVPSPSLHIIARASTWEGARHLKDAGATDVVRPELEGGLEIMRRTLMGLEFPMQEIQRYADAVRSEGLEALPARDDRAHVLEDLAHAMGGLEVSWFTVSDQSVVAGQAISDSNLRLRTGASIVAINRDAAVVSNPVLRSDSLPATGSPSSDRPRRWRMPDDFSRARGTSSSPSSRDLVHGNPPDPQVNFFVALERHP